MAQTKILVIGDDEDTLELLELLLAPETSNILVAHSEKEGIELARKHAPEVIMIDLFSVASSAQVCKTLRGFSESPILVLSTIDLPDIIAQALDAGADDYLIKPISSAILIARLHKLLRRPRLFMTTIVNPI
jgi:two-component system, OmpR family, KDP operon response regulator KdpE